MTVSGALSQHQFEFAPRPKELQTVAADDPNGVILIVRPAPENLPTVLNKNRPLGMAWRTVSLTNQGVEIQLTFAERVDRVGIQNHRDRAIVEVLRHTRASALRDRVVERLPRSVPVDFVSPALDAAETLFREGKFDEATRRYQALKKEYALEGWVGIRRADTFLLKGDLRAACTAYRVVTYEQTVRTVSQLAILRRYAAQCPEDSTDVAERAVLIERLNPYDSAVSRFLWDETLFALQLSNRAAELQEAVELTERVVAVQVFMSAWAADAASVALSRLLGQHQHPWDRAHICQRYRSLIHSTPAAQSLLLTCGQAFLELETPALALQAFEEALATPTASSRRAAWDLREGSTQLQQGLALARERTLMPDSHNAQVFVPTATIDEVAEEEPAASLLDARARLLAVTAQGRGGTNDN